MTTTSNDVLTFMRKNIDKITPSWSYFKKYNNCTGITKNCINELKTELYKLNDDYEFRTWVDKLCSNKKLLNGIAKHLKNTGILASLKFGKRRKSRKSRKVRKSRKSRKVRSRKSRKSRKFGYSHDMGPKLYNAHMQDGILLADNAFSWQGNPLARSLMAGSG